MTGRERVLAMLEGRKPDRLPCMPITMMFAGDLAGVRYADYARGHRALKDGTPHGASEAIAERHREAGERYIVTAGCEVPRGTPHTNLRALVEYARSRAGCIPAPR